MKSRHDGGKGGHFCHCDGKSINLQLTRGVPLVGQLSLYLLYDFNCLSREFTEGIIQGGFFVHLEPKSIPNFA